LFREFYSRSNLFGGSTSVRKDGTGPWHKSDNPRSGYIRSPGNDHIALRSSTNKAMGVTTTIDARVDLERGQVEKGRMQGLEKEGKLTKNQHGWNSSEVRLNGDASSEEGILEWSEEFSGIRKTVVTTADHH
jgi:hypothetical protein